MRGGWEREEHGGIWGVLSPVPWGRGRRGFAGSARLWDAMPPRAFAPAAVPGKTWDPAALGVVGALYVWCPSWHWTLALGRARQPLGTCFLIACSLPTRPHLAQADSSIICLCHSLSPGQVSSAGLFLSLSLSFLLCLQLSHLSPGLCGNIFLASPSASFPSLAGSLSWLPWVLTWVLGSWDGIQERLDGGLDLGALRHPWALGSGRGTRGCGFAAPRGLLHGAPS